MRIDWCQYSSEVKDRARLNESRAGEVQKGARTTSRTGVQLGGIIISNNPNTIISILLSA